MVEKEFTQAVNEGIKETREALTEVSQQVRKRVIELKMNPDEVISKIKQINGVLIEFEER